MNTTKRIKEKMNKNEDHRGCGQGTHKIIFKDEKIIIGVEYLGGNKEVFETEKNDFINEMSKRSDMLDCWNAINMSLYATNYKCLDANLFFEI